MRKFLFTLLVGCLALVSHAQMKYIDGSFKPYETIKNTMTETDMGRQNMTAEMIKFPQNWNGDNSCALIRVQFENMSDDEIQKVRCEAENGKHVVESKFKNTGTALELWVFVDNGDRVDLTFSHPSYGSTRVSSLKLMSKNQYQLRIQNEKTINLNFNTNPTGVTVILDGETIGESPCSKLNSTYGKHRLQYIKNGIKTDPRLIEVSDANFSFNDDLRERKDINFSAHGTNVSLMVDGEYVGMLPKTITVPFGYHKFIAESGALRDTSEIDEVSSATPENYNFRMVKKKSIEFFARYNNDRVPGANVYIDETLIGQTPATWNVPYGTSTIRMAYSNNSKSATLKVNDRTKAEFELKIPTRKRSWNPFDIDYRSRIAGISAAYVTKSWGVDLGGKKTHADIWAQEGKSLHGIQVGVPIQPTFGSGIGMNTGIFFEYYWSSNPSKSDQTYDKMEEMSLYMPVHLMFRLPLEEEFSLFINGGLGMDYGLKFNFMNDGEEGAYDQEYGSAGIPKQFNLSTEFGGGVQIMALQFSFQYSLGITNHNSIYQDDNGSPIKAKQNKMTFSLALMF